MYGKGTLRPHLFIHSLAHSLVFAENPLGKQVLCQAIGTHPWIKGSSVLRIHQEGQTPKPGGEGQVRAYSQVGKDHHLPWITEQEGKLHWSSKKCSILLFQRPAPSEHISQDLQDSFLSLF